jgi:ABC-type transporter Mla subunit MlaD
MQERSRNFVVGLTFIVAIGLFMYGIFMLGKFPGSIHEYQVTLLTPDANGITTGSKVELNGVYAGQVASSWLITDPQGKLMANIRLRILTEIDIPEKSTASLQRPVGVGNPYVSLIASDAKGKLAKDGTATLTASISDSSSLIPPSVFEDIHVLKEDLSVLSHQLTTVAQDMHTLLVYTPPEAVDKADPNDPNRPKVNASTMIIRLDHTVASLQELLGDPKLQSNVKSAVQNIAEASAQLKETLSKVDAVVANANSAITNANTAVGSMSKSITGAADAFGGVATQASTTIDSTKKQIDKVSQQLIETLSQLEKTTRELSEGKGTTGKLINDPRLYDGLLDLSKSLKSTVDDLDFLLNKWKDEGVNLHLK